MKYIHKDFVDESEIMSAEGQGYTINVRFCRDCPLFEPNLIQRNPPKRGWCCRLSCYGTTFCNEDDIGNEDDY